jgi:hypothetical protein
LVEAAGHGGGKRCLGSYRVDEQDLWGFVRGPLILLGITKTNGGYTKTTKNVSVFIFLLS